MQLFHKMADDNVLFLRGNGIDTNTDNEDVWDDSALIMAYDKAVHLAKEELVKRIGTENSEFKQETEKKLQKSKQHEPTSKLCKKWSVGAPCRAVYSEDGEVYEAIISKIYKDTDTCIVKFIGNAIKLIIFYTVGYENSEKVQLNSLLESEGLQSQIAQHKAAVAARSNEENLDDSDINFSTNMNSKMYNGEKMDCESEETKIYKHNFMAGSSFNLTADEMPPAPPLPPQLMAKLPDDDADALSSMLMSWYISGFHTGYYHGLKQARSQKERGKKC